MRIQIQETNEYSKINHHIYIFKNVIHTHHIINMHKLFILHAYLKLSYSPEKQKTDKDR
jgi:hypothetical protein